MDLPHYAEAATITLSDVADLAALERRWRAFEPHSNASFFQTADWTFCRAADRFPDPVLLEATQDGRTLALALFNRRSRRLHLGESGDPGWDSVFIEHNGVLLARDAPPDLLTACLRTLRGRATVLAGVDATHLEAAREAGALPRITAERPSPAIDLTTPFLPGLSANSRQQLRRSARGYDEGGALTLTRARTLPQARRYLDALASLHQATWTERGKPGAFAGEAFRQFHHELLARAFPAGRIDLLHITTGKRTLGYLYNFRHDGRVLAYQSGFDYALSPDPKCKPGLTCHHLAIERAQQDGQRAYDFLAGDGRYKLSLSNASTALFWLEFPRARSAGWMLARLRGG